MDKVHDIQHLSISGTIMRLRVDGRDYRINLAAVSERLRRATPAQRKGFEISPSGYGIHWPDVDEDLSIDGLIGAGHTSPAIKSKARAAGAVAHLQRQSVRQGTNKIAMEEIDAEIKAVRRKRQR